MTNFVTSLLIQKKDCMCFYKQFWLVTLLGMWSLMGNSPAFIFLVLEVVQVSSHIAPQRWSSTSASSGFSGIYSTIPFYCIAFIFIFLRHNVICNILSNNDWKCIWHVCNYSEPFPNRFRVTLNMQLMFINDNSKWELQYLYPPIPYKCV